VKEAFPQVLSRLRYGRPVCVTVQVYRSACTLWMEIVQSSVLYQISCCIQAHGRRPAVAPPLISRAAG